MAAFALRSRKSHFDEGFSGVIFVRIGFEFGPNESFDFLSEYEFTLADRHLTVCSLGADSSVYIYYITNNKRNQLSTYLQGIQRA